MSTAMHLRWLINEASQSEEHRDEALEIVERIAPGAFVSGEFPADLLVLLAESLVSWEMPVKAECVLDVFDYLKPEADQFQARAQLVRCVLESRHCCRLKGEHLIQQLRYALNFLIRALEIAQKAEFKDRYTFLVYNASLAFWDVVRPAVREGWQRELTSETERVLNALNAVVKDGVGKGVSVITPVDLPWRLELMVHYAFGLLDAGKGADAQKVIDEATKEMSAAGNDMPEWLPSMMVSARAHFAKGNAGAMGTLRKDMEITGGTAGGALATALFVQNGAVPDTQVRDEISKAWIAIDASFKGVLDAFAKDEKCVSSERPGSVSPEQQLALASLVRATCGAKVWPLAELLFNRLLEFRAPQPRGRILMDLCKSELDVYKACLVGTDAKTGMVLLPDVQYEREIMVRTASCRLAEQCVLAAKRTGNLDLLEESATIMWEIGIPLLTERHRLKVHKSLQQAADALADMQSTAFLLRVHLHTEISKCEIGLDLLTKGQTELKRAKSLDATLKTELEDKTEDPQPYIRQLDATINPMVHLLHWKLSIYEDPSEVCDQVMLLLDQVQQLKSGTKNLSLAANLIQKGFESLAHKLESLQDELDNLSDTYAELPLHLTEVHPLKALPQRAPCTTKSGGPDPINILDAKPLSPKEVCIAEMKFVLHLCSRLASEARRVGNSELGIRCANRAIELEKAKLFSFGPYPKDVHFIIALAEAAFVKANCLRGLLGPMEAGTTEEADEDFTEEEAAEALQQKADLIDALLYGMKLASTFRQNWLVINGLAHWWNLHLEIMQHGLHKVTTDEFVKGLQKAAEFMVDVLKDKDMVPTLALNLTLMLIRSCEAKEKFAEMGELVLKILPQLAPTEKKEAVAQFTEVYFKNSHPQPALPNDDARRVESIVMRLIEEAPFVDKEKALQLVYHAAEKLSEWTPASNDELELTLWVEMWTRLGRRAITFTDEASNAGPKAALMCSIKALGEFFNKECTMASDKRFAWIGAAHALGGQAFNRLVDPEKQEEESILKLRKLAMDHFRQACEYSTRVPTNVKLIGFATKAMWNTALPLLQSVASRKMVVAPFIAGVKAIETAKFVEDPEFCIGFYTALFNCYSDVGDTESIHKILNGAFKSLPSSDHRKLWAMRMRCLSREGKNMDVAMSKMKETKPEMQARIWLVLTQEADSSEVSEDKDRNKDQLKGYLKAIDILAAAQNTSCVDVRLELADWLARHGYPREDTMDQIQAAADMLLAVEDLSFGEEAKNATDSGSIISGTGTSMTGSRSDAPFDGRARSNSLRHSSRGSQKSRTRSRGASVAKSSTTSNSSSRRCVDMSLPSQLHARNFGQLIRVYVAEAVFGGDVCASLLNACHFVLRAFEFTVQQANAVAARIKQLETESAQGMKRKSGFESMNIKEYFALPTILEDWIDTTPITPLLLEVMKKAETEFRIDFYPFVGHESMFGEPLLMFHGLCKFEEMLLSEGFHQWTLPTLEMHRWLVNTCWKPEKDERLIDTMNIFLDMRRSRVAAALHLPNARPLWDGVKDRVAALPSTFHEYGDELKQACGQRVEKSSGEKFNVAFRCDSVRSFEILFLIAQECWIRGEISICSQVTDEVARHAEIYNDVAGLRKALILKALVCSMEGRYNKVPELLSGIKCATVEQTADVVFLLVTAYDVLEQPHLIEEVLKDATKAITAAPGCSSTRMALSKITLVSFRQRFKKLCASPVFAKGYFAMLDALLVSFSDALSLLDDLPHAMLECAIAGCRDFHALFHSMHLTLQHDPTTDVRHPDGVLSLELLAGYVDKLSATLAKCEQARKDIAKRVALGGHRPGSVQPCEILGASFDTHREMTLKMHRRLKQFSSDKYIHPEGLSLALPKVLRAADCFMEDPNALTVVGSWMELTKRQVEEQEAMLRGPRPLQGAEQGVLLTGNALATKFPAPETNPNWITRMEADAQVAYGCAVQEKKTVTLWKDIDRAEIEMRAMAIQDAISYKNQNRVPFREQESSPDGAPQDEDTEAAAERLEISPQTDYLYDVALKCLLSGHFSQAATAFDCLAFEVHGSDHKTTFWMLAWRQHARALLWSLKLTDDVLPIDHQERVLRRHVAHVEAHWSNPWALEAYSKGMAILNASPHHEVLMCNRALPAENELLQKAFPRNTLLISLQAADGYLFVGCCHTLEKPKFYCFRVPVSAGNLLSRAKQLQELTTQIEKEVLIHPDTYPKDLLRDYQKVFEEIDDFFKPISDLITGVFHPFLNDDTSPEHMVFFLDFVLQQIPLERLKAFGSLPMNRTRDFSLMIFAFRALPYFDDKGVPCSIPVAKDDFVFLGDPFSEDAGAEDGSGPTMCEIAQKIEDSKIAEVAHGEKFLASPQELVRLLQDSSFFTYMGFGRFMTTLPSPTLISQDLSHLKVIATFCRCCNDASFRRQTKTDSVKGMKQLQVEMSVLNMALLATIRGVKTIVTSTGMYTVPLAMAVADTFLRKVHGGDTVQVALQAVSKLRGDSSVRGSVTGDNPLLPPFAQQNLVMFGLPWIAKKK